MDAVFRIQGKTAATVTAERLTIGTRSTCDIALNDPVAAEQHCELIFDSGRFLIEDGRNGTGTWVDGLAVTGAEPLPARSSIVIGVSRLRVTLDEGAERPTLIVQVEEASFHFKQKDKKEFKRDPDQWVYSEVGFGRFPALRRANLAALVLAVVLGAAAWLVPAQQAWLAPGALSEAHALLFERAPEDFADARLTRLATLAQAQGCAVCHVGGERVPNDSCAVCHEELASPGLHPFVSAGRELDTTLALRAPGRHECIACHREHGGRQPAAGELVPQGDGVAATCTRCHAPEQNITLLSPERRAGLIEAEMATLVPMESERPLRAPSFSHAAHSLAGLACSACHERAPADAGQGDWAVVSFSTCMTCHADRTGTGSVAQAAAQPIGPGHIPSVEFLFDLAWHGSSERCESCHTDRHAAELRTVERTVWSPSRWRLQRRHHPEVDDDQRCTECHLAGTPLLTELQVESPFDHRLHLANSAPTSSAAAQSASGECSVCHAATAESAALMASNADLAASTAAGCGECHQGADGQSSIVGLVPASASAERTLTDFPHSLHPSAAMADGCFTCHELDSAASGIGAFRTKPEASSCLTCHADHASLAGGACATCHRDPAVFRGSFESRPWPSGWSFSHSSSGHRELVEGQACAGCHEGIENATTIAEVRIPVRSDSVCAKCHAGTRTRFHFVLGR